MLAIRNLKFLCLRLAIMGGMATTKGTSFHYTAGAEAIAAISKDKAQ